MHKYLNLVPFLIILKNFKFLSLCREILPNQVQNDYDEVSTEIFEIPEFSDAPSKESFSEKKMKEPTQGPINRTNLRKTRKMH